MTYSHLNRTIQSILAAGVLMLVLSACSPATQAPATPTAAPKAVATEPPKAAAPPVAPTTAPAPTGQPSVPTTAPTAAPKSAAPTTTPAKRLSIVVTTTIIGDLVKNVVGGAADVTALLPYGADPHTFEPSPRDSQTLARADVLVENGVGLEEWLEGLIKNSGTKAQTVVASKGLKLREGEHGHDDEKKDAGATPAVGVTPGAKKDEDHEYDPHLWMDVQNAMRYVENVRDALVAADAPNAATYRANADKYLGQLKELDQYIAQQAATIPEARRKLVTSHETFGYFAERYGFDVVGTVIPSVSAEAQPSAQDVAKLMATIKAQNVPAVFAESTVNPRLAEQIAKDAGVKVVMDLYTDSLSQAGQPGETYVKMMRHNIDQIVKALK